MGINDNGRRLAGQAMNDIAPSVDFRAAVDDTRFTKAIYFAPTTGTAFNIYNEITEGDVQFYTGGQVLPVSTKTTVTISGFAVVYLY